MSVLQKAGTAAGAILAIVAIGALFVSSVTWKVKADDSHKASAAATQEMFSIKELVVILGNKESTRSAREEQQLLVEAKAAEARESAQRAHELLARAEESVISRLCQSGVLKGEMCL